MNAQSVVVIGAGPGGEAAAKHLAERGIAVTLVEQGPLGGLCLNWGCIPTKILLEAGRLSHQARASAVLQGGRDVCVDWEKLQEKKRGIVDSFRNALDHRFNQLRVRMVKGTARFLSGRTLSVTGPNGSEVVPFDVAVIATGSAPFFPRPFDTMADSILDSQRALSLPSVPRHLAVVGAGAVGLEFACLFHELGSRVTVIEKKIQILPGEEASVARLLQKSFEKRGMKICTDRTVDQAERAPDGWRLVLSDGETLTPDQVLVCVGRRPATDGLGLETAGVSVDNGRIGVNNHMQTSRASVYAVGDVNGLSLLAHAAAAQGVAAANHILGTPVPYDNERVPRCLYTWPEVASVGEWTHSAALKNVEVKAQRFFFQGSPKALASDETEGFLQILSAKGDGRLLGAQMVGPHATELIHIFATALAEKMTVERLRQVIFAHPTLAEGIREALSR
jgi:dihydrolipoamide dehydrogenase